MVSSPLRAIILLSFSSPRRGTPLFQVQGAYEEKAHPRDRGLEEKPDCGFGLTISTCIRIFPNFNICCIRVKHLNSCNYWVYS